MNYSAAGLLHPDPAGVNYIESYHMVNKSLHVGASRTNPVQPAGFYWRPLGSCTHRRRPQHHSASEQQERQRHILFTSFSPCTKVLVSSRLFSGKQHIALFWTCRRTALLSSQQFCYQCLRAILTLKTWLSCSVENIDGMQN